jgi:hypothetical protein
LFLKKLVGDVLDRVDQFDAFEPRQHYALTLSEAEMTVQERSAAQVGSVDDIELDLGAEPARDVDRKAPPRD